METQIDQIRLKRKIAADWLVTADQLKVFTLADFKNPQTYRRLLETVADPQFNAELALAGNFLMTLTNALKPFDNILRQESPALYQDYQKIITYLQFLALPADSADELEKIFAANILFAFDWGVAIEDQIIFVFSYFALQTDAIAKIQIPALRGLKTNKEKLGSKDIMVDNKPLPPYISHWLKDYDYFSGGFASERVIEEVAYLNQSANVRLLNTDEKEILRQVIRVYNLLRFPVLAPRAEARATGHRLPDALKPVGERIQADVAGERETAQAILAAYQGDSRQAEAIKQAEDKLKKVVGTDSAKIRDEFFSAVQLKNAGKTIACLRLLAQGKDLAEFIKTDTRLNKFLASVWQKKYGEAFVKEFLADPAKPKFVRAFLQYVLQERLAILEADAARIGLQLGNILVSQGKNEYGKMAFFDLQDKKFKWFTD